MCSLPSIRRTWFYLQLHSQFTLRIEHHSNCDRTTPGSKQDVGLWVYKVGILHSLLSSFRRKLVVSNSIFDTYTLVIGVPFIRSL